MKFEHRRKNFVFIKSKQRQIWIQERSMYFIPSSKTRKSNNWKIKYFQSFKMFRNKSSNTTHYITKTDKQLFQQLHCQIGNVQSYTNTNPVNISTVKDPDVKLLARQKRTVA